MRFDLLLEPFYILSAFWGGVPGTQICTVAPLTSVVREARTIHLKYMVPADTITAFIDVNVIPMDTERVLIHQTVIVRNGVIAEIGPVGKVMIPARAARIDSRGKYLIPGLGDMHGHFSLRLLRSLAKGITTLRRFDDPSPEEVQQPSRLSTEEYLKSHDWEQGLSLRIYTGIRSRVMTARQDSIPSIIAQIRAEGYDQLTLSPLGFPHPYRKVSLDTMVVNARFDSVVASARRHNLRLASHNHRLPFRQVLALGPGGSSEHLYAYWDALGLWKEKNWGLRRAIPDSELRELAVLTREAGVWITPTLQCMQGLVLNNPQRERYVTFFERFVKILHEEGVGLLLAADDDFDVHDELEAMVRAGLSPYQALLTGTRNVAQHLDALEQSGTVAVGKWADLVLLSGNPLDDVRYSRDPAGVMIGGRWLNRVELDQHLFPSIAEWLQAQPALSNLIDSLETTPPSEHMVAERLSRKLGNEIRTLRASWPGWQNHLARYDQRLQIWLREQKRRGRDVKVPGFTSLP